MPERSLLKVNAEEIEHLTRAAVALMGEGEAASLGTSEYDLSHHIRNLVEFLLSGLPEERRGIENFPGLKGELERWVEEGIERRLVWKVIDCSIGAITSRIGQIEHQENCLTETFSRLNRNAASLYDFLVDLYVQRKNEEMGRYVRLEEEIDEFPSTLASITDVDTLLKNGLNKLQEIVSASHCAILLGDSSTGPVWTRLSLKGGEKLIGLPMEMDPPVKDLLYEKGGSFESHASSWDTPAINHIMFSHGLGSTLIVPMRLRARTVGLILVSRKDDTAFRMEERSLVERFAARLAYALENTRLHASEQQKIKESMTLLEISRAINSTLDLSAILHRVTQMTGNLVGASSCVIYLLDARMDTFFPRAIHTASEELRELQLRGQGFTYSLLPVDIVEKLHAGLPVSIARPEKHPLIPAGLLDNTKVRSLVLLPLKARRDLIGIMAIFHPRSTDEIDEEEINVISAIGNQAAVAIENATLYEDIEKSYYSTVKALAKAIEVKDPYTFGHSERVTEYALAIAEAMGLDEVEKQNIKYAATLHDIGKIGIAGKVLNKPGALTDEEYLHVKTHPLLGDSIIEPVEFLQMPRPLILHHHERYDGKGYPDGLKGEEIPLGARIITVADSYEAMRSDRPYRKALSPEAAREELIRNRGTQFDPQVVDIFLQLLDHSHIESSR
jgi:response regulator RpfG family c-di-GMP phosphodiesterase